MPDRRLHIVGCPRSGTTLMTELLRYAYDFAGAAPHEQSLFARVDAQQFPFLSKKPSDTTRIDPAFVGDPNLYVVAMVRDPRSVVSSIHRSRPGQYFVDFSRWRKHAAAIQKQRYHQRYLMVRYEDLLTKPAYVQQGIEQLAPWLQRTGNFEQFPDGIERLNPMATDALNGARPLDVTRLNSWREHLPRVRAELDANPDMATFLEHLGYEQDSSWTQALDGVIGAGTTAKKINDAWWRRLEGEIRYWRRNRRYLENRRLDATSMASKTV